MVIVILIIVYSNGYSNINKGIVMVIVIFIKV